MQFYRLLGNIRMRKHGIYCADVILHSEYIKAATVFNIRVAAKKQKEMQL